MPAIPERPRVVLDTNTVLDWIVFADEPAVCIGTAVSQRTVDWLASARMLDELRAVLSRPLPPRWEAARAQARMLDVASMVLLCPEPQPGPNALVCRDPDDQVFIDLAMQHSPALLLTRDRALLDLRRRAAARGVTVATPAAWHARAVSAGLALSAGTEPP
jgi:uncharacterized protein